uniref:Tim44 domain-containing protein n=1 Tax=Rhabditophanes sp. KR3021 TaxID=114890 RepID=A0AC35TUW1_9BILA
MNRLTTFLPRTLLKLQDLSITQAAGVHHHKERGDLELFLGIKRSNTGKANRNTHKNERMFRKMRGRKTMILNLPDDVKVRERNTMKPDELRKSLLSEGINPYKEVSPRQWDEHQMTLQSHYGVLEPYLSPEQPLSIATAFSGITGGKMKLNEIKERGLHKFHSWKNGVRAIRNKEGYKDFDPKKFAGEESFDIYKQAYGALMDRNKKDLSKFITEHAFVKMWPDVENGSIYWEFVEETATPEVVSIRCGDNPYNSGNAIAQIIVKMCSKQKLAVYDRFGQMTLGSKERVKDVIEFVVFENHIADADGKWRLHDKIHPKWVTEAKEGTIGTQLLDEPRKYAPEDHGMRSASLAQKQMERKKED